MISARSGVGGRIGLGGYRLDRTPTSSNLGPVALAQDDSATDAGEPTDLAVVALNCAEAPNTEALTSFFTDGTPPNECAPRE